MAIDSLINEPSTNKSPETTSLDEEDTTVTAVAVNIIDSAAITAPIIITSDTGTQDLSASGPNKASLSFAGSSGIDVEELLGLFRLVRQ